MTRDEAWIEISWLAVRARIFAYRLEESSEQIEGVAGLALVSAAREARAAVSWLEVALDALDADVRDDDETWNEWEEDLDCQGGVR